MLGFVTPATSTALVTLAAAKTELDITGSSSDAALGARIDDISAEIAGLCNRENFGSARVEERLSVRRGTKWPLWLRHWPVTAIISVTEDGTPLETTDYLLGEKRQLLRRDAQNGHIIPWRACEIVVTYDGGYNLPGDCPGDLRRAALLLLTASWRSTGRDMRERAVSVPGVMDVTYAVAGSLPAHLEATLARYTNSNVG